MIAIRCRDSQRSFRRSGVLFPGNGWTFVEDATPAQLAEPQLVCVEVENEDDPRLTEFPIAPEGDPSTLEDADTPALSDFDARVRNEQLERENAALKNEVADFKTIRDGLVEQVRLLHETNEALGTERDALREQAQARHAEAITPSAADSEPILTPEPDAETAPTDDAPPADTPLSLEADPTPDSKSGKGSKAAAGSN